MKVYVVVNHYMNGLEAEAVFSSMDNAQQYITNRKKGGSPEVIGQDVHGEMELPNQVFSASCYHRDSDLHIYKELHDTFEAADRAAGVDGLVLPMIIDEKLG